MRRLALLLVAFLASSASAAPGWAAPAKSSSVSVGKSTKKSAKKSRVKKRRPAGFTGQNARKDEYRQAPLDKPSGEIWLRAENLNEEVRVNIYKPDGNFDDAAFAQLDDLFRCAATGKVRAVRAELYEQLSRIHDHFDKKPLVLVSGFRAAIGSTVERTSSRHYHASAADFRIKDVSITEIRKYAESLDMGNMGIGIYPNSQFVHVDFRAPGEPSFRWVDYSGRSQAKKSQKHKQHKKQPGRTQPARKPVS